MTSSDTHGSQQWSKLAICTCAEEDSLRGWPSEVTLASAFDRFGAVLSFGKDASVPKSSGHDTMSSPWP
uniref:Uncharacterized protein n=1 Tax=Panagrellus redivivus TaxID=6233 RepID=A0A7E4V4A3_PANRE